MRFLPLLIFVGCSPALSLSPGDHYYCSEALVENLGKLQEAVSAAGAVCESADSKSASLGDSDHV